MSEHNSFSLNGYYSASDFTENNEFQQKQLLDNSNTTNSISTESSSEEKTINALNVREYVDFSNKNNNSWLNQSESYQSLDSILNMSNPERFNSTSNEESNSNYQHLFEFLPFDDVSDHLILPNNNRQGNEPSESTIQDNNNDFNHDIHISNFSNTTNDNSSTTTDKNNNSDLFMNHSNIINNMTEINATHFNEQHNNLITSSQNKDENLKLIIPYFDPLDGTFSQSKDDLMNSYLANAFSSGTTPSSSPTAVNPSLGQQHQHIQTPILDFQLNIPSQVHSSNSSENTVKNDNELKSCIQRYLQADDPFDAGEKMVIIMTSKVAQKSYGTEKRFLCPPPTTILVGSSWWTPPSRKKDNLMGEGFEECLFRDKENVLRAPPSLTVCISGESSNRQVGKVDWYSKAGTLIGQTKGAIDQKETQSTSNSTKHISSNDLNQVTLPDNKSTGSENWYRDTNKEGLVGGRCVLKRVYINDADEKRKKVQCLFRIQLADGLMLGTLSSRSIKVISKPSKKRQSVKNMELCIYHGTTISLFNRIRSQNVSTKYLGVSSTFGKSSIFDYPGRIKTQNGSSPTDDTCFVARTSSWDSFLIWVVDTSQADPTKSNSTPGKIDEYIGCPSIISSIPYPTPPTVALKNKTNQPLAIRYNQHVVLQCLTTGLVSPIMIIRKVDKASTVLGGASCPKEIDPSFSGGGEFGDEVLGDPVSQLHKISLQIVSHEAILHRSTELVASDSMMPKMTAGRTSYLACLTDMVGTHQTTTQRTPVRGHQFNMTAAVAAAAAASGCYSFTASSHSATLNSDMVLLPYSTGRKRRASVMDQTSDPSVLKSNALGSHLTSAPSSSPFQDRSAAANRKNSLLANGGQALAEFGAYWSEEVSDSSVWTIVGTECARYRFWVPPCLDESKLEESQMNESMTTLFPRLTHFVISEGGDMDLEYQKIDNVFGMMTASGENFTRDLKIWFGDVKAPFTEYRSREMLVCQLPPREELLKSARPNEGYNLNRIHEIDDSDYNDRDRQLPYAIQILLVRGDGVVYKTSRFYFFA